MTPENYQPIKSSNLISAAYNPATRECFVEFKNGTYKYSDCSPETWANFEQTFQSEDSSGKYFAANIKPLKFEKM